MNKQILEIILLLILIYIVKADVKELKLNDRTYLPPKDKGYLPPEKTEVYKEKLKDLKYLPPENPDVYKNKLNDLKYLPPQESGEKERGYQYNKPKVIDDPLPMKVNYVEPLTLDFLSGQYKPLVKGGFIPALFINENDLQSLNRETLKEVPLNDLSKMKIINITKSFPRSELHTKVYYALKASDIDITKAEGTNQKNKFVKRPAIEEELVPINHYAEDKMIYILFNYDDDSELSASEPVVIYKPGDDIRFTEDLTVIDNYEHMFPKEKVKEDEEITSATITTSVRTTPKTISTKTTPRTTFRTTPRTTTRTTSKTTPRTTFRTKPRTTTRTTSKTTPRTTTRRTTPKTTYSTTTLRSTSQITSKTTPRRTTTSTTPRTTTRKITTTTTRAPSITPSTHPKSSLNSYSIDHQSSEEESESNHSTTGHGYFYEKPKIPFTF